MHHIEAPSAHNARIPEALLNRRLRIKLIESGFEIDFFFFKKISL